MFTLTLTTKVSAACTWTVSPQALVVKVTSGTDRIWSTQECHAARSRSSPSSSARTSRRPSRSAWNGQRSDADCTRSTAWAEPGYYHVVAASFGADPVDVQFALSRPVPRDDHRDADPAQHAGAAKASRHQLAEARRRRGTPGPAALPAHCDRLSRPGPRARPSAQT